MLYESFDYEPLRRAGAAVFDQEQIPSYSFDRANFILSFGAEFLETWISNVEFTEAYARLRSRQLRDPAGTFIWVAPRLSLTGLNSDGWMSTPPGSEAAVACAIANAMIADGLGDSSVLDGLRHVRAALDRFIPDHVAQLTGVSAAAIHGVARRFARPGASLAIGGGVAAETTSYPDSESASQSVPWFGFGVGVADRTVSAVGGGVVSARRTA